VGEHNACRSLMAEAIANSLGEPKFLFSSAGLDPRPITPATLDFMKEKGFDLARVAPKYIYEVPNLEHFQVVVGVAREAQEAFPRTPRKMVYVDWRVDDPSEVEGPPEKVRAAYDAAFDFFSSHVRDLVEAVLGNDVDQRSLDFPGEPR